MVQCFASLKSFEIGMMEALPELEDRSNHFFSTGASISRPYSIIAYVLLSECIAAEKNHLAR